MNKRLSLTNLSYTEEILSKLQTLDRVRNVTNATIVQSNHPPKANTKLKTSIRQKLINSTEKKRTPQSLPYPSYQHNLSNDKLILNYSEDKKSKTQFHSPILNDRFLVTSNLISPQVPNSPANDEHSILSIPINNSIDSQRTFSKHSQEDSQISEFPYRKYRSTRSITSSSSSSKHSHDEPPLAPDTLVIGKLYILNEIYPSIEHENLNGTPLAFLGAEKLLRNRLDWTKVPYLLSSRYIEIIIDLIIARPSFIKEIPKVTKFNLYRPLIKTVSGHLFFDHGENRAGIHQCDRKRIDGSVLRKFTIQDLVSIHQREFHIIMYNSTREQRFINLYEKLFPIHLYQTKSTHWKTYLTKSKRPIHTLDLISGTSTNKAEINYINNLLTLNQTFPPITSIDRSTRKRNRRNASTNSSPISMTERLNKNPSAKDNFGSVLKVE